MEFGKSERVKKRIQCEEVNSKVTVSRCLVTHKIYGAINIHTCVIRREPKVEDDERAGEFRKNERTKRQQQQSDENKKAKRKDFPTCIE